MRQPLPPTCECDSTTIGGAIPICNFVERDLALMNIPMHRDMSHRHVVIVDPEISNYTNILNSTQDPIDCITITTTASGALRLAPSHCDARWLINAALPDMSGLALLELLLAIELTLKVEVIVETYDIEEEQEALRLGARHYRTKPRLDHVTCFDDW
jgi:DNA-binding NarL/FixJ family response regulator